mgnify:FL=1
MLAFSHLPKELIHLLLRRYITEVTVDDPKVVDDDVGKQQLCLPPHKLLVAMQIHAANLLD